MQVSVRRNRTSAELGCPLLSEAGTGSPLLMFEDVTRQNVDRLKGTEGLIQATRRREKLCGRRFYFTNAAAEIGEALR